MKELLSIIFMGLLLVSCSDVKTEKMLETCADENFESMIGNTPLLTLRLKGKLLDKDYYFYHANCEEDLNNHPKTFKTTWDR
jgi:hypothetical protein|tara:strand:- start:402 stop:647 length:246 start_codon:yes stop_codon:yes gene_type:complete